MPLWLPAMPLPLLFPEESIELGELHKAWGK
jgi:hypothetical protein